MERILTFVTVGKAEVNKANVVEQLLGFTVACRRTAEFLLVTPSVLLQINQIKTSAVKTGFGSRSYLLRSISGKNFLCSQ